VTIIEPDDFARRFSLRAQSLMWLVGAGASAAAGIPTAGDMIWEFKQRLYVSQRRVSPKSIQDLGNAAVRAQLQSYFDASSTYPPPGSSDEYAHFFEAAWPNEGDRRAYIDAKLSGAKPSYGHLALATFMRASLTKLIWTTNFDPLIADACAKVYESTGALTSVALDAPELAREILAAHRRPVEIKLHGDFRSRRLKNTGDELRHQDALLRQILIDSCGNAGMIVAGYSGRDTSIMERCRKPLLNRIPFRQDYFGFIEMMGSHCRAYSISCEKQQNEKSMAAWSVSRISTKHCATWFASPMG
jgi:NAD-dependent SIR2 family protein deacetylase